MQDFPALYLK